MAAIDTLIDILSRLEISCHKGIENMRSIKPGNRKKNIESSHKKGVEGRAGFFGPFLIY